jgi:Cytochrome oxidase complex assembly protein 1
MVVCMSDPSQPIPPPKEPRKQSGTLLAAIVIAVVLMMFGCGGACAGFLYLTVPQARQAMRDANLPFPEIAVAPAQNDWMTTRILSEVYTRALAVVVADKQVIERLGEPVLTDIEADELYRRTDMGALSLDGGEKEIQFDIKGPKGTGVVAVMSQGQTNITKITVTFGDGSSIDIPPPQPQPLMVR